MKTTFNNYYKGVILNMIEISLANISYFFNFSFIIIIIYLMRKNKQYKQANQKVASELQRAKKNIDYEKHIKFLHNLIQFKLEVNKDYYIEALVSGEEMLVNDDIYEKYLRDISKEIIDSLSEDYRYTMRKYFKDESLDEYIISLVNYSLIEMINSINNDKITDILNR
jgi:hypothetical protein